MLEMIIKREKQAIQLQQEDLQFEEQFEQQLKQQANKIYQQQLELQERKRKLQEQELEQQEREETEKEDYEDDHEEQEEVVEEENEVEGYQMEQQQPQVRKDNDSKLNLSFCGCGFLGIYHVGVASCFLEYAPQLSTHKIAGSSAGALVAVSHICGNLQLAYATTDFLRVAIDARARALGPFHPSFDMNATVREALVRGLPEDVHIKASGRLHISLTRVYDGNNVIISEFDSKEEVIQALLCSCFIPFFSGLVAPKFRGVTYVDGGFSNNLLILDNKTITVSPFAGEADICPQDDTFNLLQISLKNSSFSLSPNNLYRLSHALMPPAPEVLSDLCEQGFADGIRFLQRMRLISCTKCLQIRSSLLVTTNGEDMEEAFAHESSFTTDLSSDGRADSYDDVNSSSFDNCYNAQTTHHIRLELQEQKTIEINENQRRGSVVSTTSQLYQQQQQQITTPSSSTSISESFKRFTKTTSVRETFRSKDKTGSYTGTSIRGNNNNNNNNNNNYGDILNDGFDNNCDECVLMRQKALYEPLPKQFSDRMREACDTVNKSLSNWIYSHRPIKYLSYLVAPYYVPLDISLALIYRCWCRLPYIRSELINCIYEIAEFLIGIIKRMHQRSTTTMLMESGVGAAGGCDDWIEEKKAVRKEKESIRQLQQKHSNFSSDKKRMASLDITSPITKKLASSLTPPKADSNEVFSGISGGGSSCKKNKNPITTTTTSTTATAAASASAELCRSSISVKITNEGVCMSKVPNSSTGGQQQQQLHSLEDTFDSIVDVTSRQEARIFAYYFRDAKNRLQVTEIFDYDRAKELSAASAALPNTNQQQTSMAQTTTTTSSSPLRQHLQSHQNHKPHHHNNNNNNNNNHH